MLDGDLVDLDRLPFDRLPEHLLFRPGERVLLRFINGSADTFFDLRLPGLAMKVVEVSGQWVEPVETDEIRLAVAETYAVLVEPREGRAYAIFAEAMDQRARGRDRRCAFHRNHPRHSDRNGAAKSERRAGRAFARLLTFGVEMSVGLAP